MAKTIIEVTGQVELIYNEKSKEFKESLAAFGDLIMKGATKEDMLKHVAFYVTRFGAEGMIEGVGYVGYNGRKPEGEPYSGIVLGKNYDEFDFEILY